jgi:hypothetical protein
VLEGGPILLSFRRSRTSEGLHRLSRGQCEFLTSSSRLGGKLSSLQTSTSSSTRPALRKACVLQWICWERLRRAADSAFAAAGWHGVVFGAGSGRCPHAQAGPPAAPRPLSARGCGEGVPRPGPRRPQRPRPVRSRRARVPPHETARAFLLPPRAACAPRSGGGRRRSRTPPEA